MIYKSQSQVDQVKYMTEKAGRNDPCPCGSGKKYKQCCWNKRLPLSKRKFKATLISSGNQPKEQKPVNLMERAFGNAVMFDSQEDRPPLAPTPPPEREVEKKEENEK